jgi:predicted transcriptional regulator
MPESIREMTTRIVSAYASQNTLKPAELKELMDTVYKSLAEMKDTADQSALRDSSKGEDDTQVKPAAEDALASIKEDKIICLECNKDFTMLTERHLKRAHGMTRAEYLVKHGLPSRQSLVSQQLAEKRKKSAKERGLGKTLKHGAAGEKQATAEQKA